MENNNINGGAWRRGELAVIFNYRDLLLENTNSSANTSSSSSSLDSRKTLAHACPARARERERGRIRECSRRFPRLLFPFHSFVFTRVRTKRTKVDEYAAARLTPLVHAGGYFNFGLDGTEIFRPISRTERERRDEVKSEGF